MSTLVELSENQINEIRQYWASVDVEVRELKANAIACLLRKYRCGINELARALDCTPKLIRKYLDFYGVSQAGAKCEGGTTVPSCDCDIPLNKAEKVVSHHAPDDGDSDLMISIGEYEQQGYEPAVARRIARAELAAEHAIDAGKIEETQLSKVKKIRRLVESGSETVIDDLMYKFLDHTNRIADALRFLDDANMMLLNRSDVFHRVMELDKRWTEQVERIRNLHENLEPEY